MTPQSEAGELPKKVRKHLLKHIERVFPVLAKPPRQSVDPFAMAEIQGFHRRLVTVISGTDQLLVGEGGGVLWMGNHGAFSKECSEGLYCCNLILHHLLFRVNHKPRVAFFIHTGIAWQAPGAGADTSGA